MENNFSKYPFTFGYFSKKDLILFLISPLLYVTNEFIHDIESFNYILNDFESILSNYLGYLIFSGTLLLFSTLKKKKNKKLEKNLNHYYFEISIDNNIKKIYFLIIIIFLEYISYYLINFFINLKRFNVYYLNLFPLEIILLVFFSKYLLKLIIYEHHLFSIVIIIIGMIIIQIIDINIINDINFLDLFMIFGIIIIHFLYCFEDIIVYYLLDVMNYDFYLFNIQMGIIGIIFYIIVLILNKLLDKRILNIDFPNSDIFFFLLISLYNGITYFFFWLIFKLYKPWFYCVFAPIHGLFKHLFEIIFKDYNINKYNIIKIFIYIILIFACLIFNEHIICNFWGLNKNTKNNIINRAHHEIIHILLIENI